MCVCVRARVCEESRGVYLLLFAELEEEEEEEEEEMARAAMSVPRDETTTFFVEVR